MAKEDRDRLTTRTDASSGATLVHTRDLDKFELAKDEPDPRGWDVRSTDGTKIGKVEDLLFDTAERRIRYIEVALAKDIAKGFARDYALIPIGQARLDDDDDDVIVELSSTDLASLPRYDRTHLSRDYESSLKSWVRERKRDIRADVRDATLDRDLGFYSSPEYDDRRFFARGGHRETGAQDRARTTGIADRISDAADNLKDRVDGNPASRPGPDATDRPL
jgi:sporulation protein YlmC with PRC-barrel domain